MKLLTKLLLLSSVALTSNALAVPYNEDEQEFWVEGQVLNETLSSVNFFMCIAKAMRPDAFVNAGPYIATLYPKDCETSGADAASDQASATATSSKSSSTASAGGAATTKKKDSDTATLQVTRADSSSPVNTRAHIPVDAKMEDGYIADPAVTIYMGLQQFSGPSSTSPNGEFQMATAPVVDSTVGEIGDYPNGAVLQPEILISAGNRILYDAGYQEKISIEYMENGDKRGVLFATDFYDLCWGEYNDGDENTAGCTNGQGKGRYVDQYLQYYLSKTDQAFCQSISSVELWLLEYDDEGEINGYDISEIADDLDSHPYAGLSTDESCYTTDREKAVRNVHRYGTYIDGGAEDGERLPVTNGSFPLYADVTGSDGEPFRAHAWADYWGVWLEPEARSLVNASTSFKKETFDENDSSGAESYNLTPSDIRVEKRETTYLALNDLDGLAIRMWVDDDWWKTEYTALFGGATAYGEYEGVFDKDGASDGSGSFTFTKGIKFEPEYVEETLSSPVSFSIAQWQAKMVKAYGNVGDDWYSTEVKQMGVWSTDTNQWYEISEETLASPATASQSAGMRTETTSTISASDITETLYCFRECVDGARVVQTFTQAVAAGASTVSSPFADTGGGLAEEVVTTLVNDDRFRSMSEATDDFWLTDNALQSSGFKLGPQGAAVSDAIGGNSDVRSYMRIGYDGMFEYNRIDDVPQYQASYFLQSNGFSVTNLNKLLTADASDPGLVPIFNLDIKSIPPAGTSGSMTLKVVVNSNGNETWQTGDRALSAEATFNYSSDGSQFMITLPTGTTVDMTYVTTSGVAVTADYVTTFSKVFAYAGGDQNFGSVKGQTGLSWDIFQLFSGHSGLAAFNSAGVASFFEAGDNPAAFVNISGTTLAMEGPAPDGDASFNKMTFQFSVRDDADLTRTETYAKGSIWEGVRASDIYSYTVNSGQLVDQNNAPITKGTTASNALASSDDAYGMLANVSFPNAYGDVNYLAWGVGTNQLVGASDLSKMECRKNGKDQIYDFHPVYGESTDITRYCDYQIWESDISTTYSFRLESEPSYSLTLESTAQPVVIDQPKTLYYDVPETQYDDGSYIFGDDRGKRIRLEYQGHGALYGIPGYVYNTCTNEDLGEFVNNWDECYRYLNRFTIPDGGLLTDPLDSSASYKVKALDGEEWLSKADGSVSGVADVRGRYTDLYRGDKADLQTDIPTVSEPTDAYYIGEPVTSGFINDGKASVVHGEVVYKPGS